MFNIYKKQKKYKEENVLQARDIVDNTSAIIHMDTFEKQKHLAFYCLFHKINQIFKYSHFYWHKFCKHVN